MESGKILISKINPSIGIRIYEIKDDGNICRCHYIDFVDNKPIFNLYIFEDFELDKIKKHYK
jgi:hypothetical protein